MISQRFCRVPNFTICLHVTSWKNRLFLILKFINLVSSVELGDALSYVYSEIDLWIFHDEKEGTNDSVVS